MARKSPKSTAKADAASLIDSAIFARTIREARELTGYSVREVARKAGVGPNTVARLEQGETSARFDNLVAVLSVLRLAVPQLIPNLMASVSSPAAANFEEILRHRVHVDLPKLLRNIADMATEDEKSSRSYRKSSKSR